MSYKKILTIQDISCVGQCSLTVALPIISAMGVETAIIPTALLSTHTMFKNFTVKDLTDLSDTVENNQIAVDEALSDLEDAIAAEEERALAAEQANATEIAKKADKATTLAGYGIADAYTKEEANQKIEDALKAATGGESASDVKVALDNYKEANDERVDAIEATYVTTTEFEKAVDTLTDAIEDESKAREAAVGLVIGEVEKLEKSLAPVAKSGLIDDLSIGEGTILIFDCGDSKQ